MKKLLFISIVLFSFACTKAPDHHVRIANNTNRIISITLDSFETFDSIQPNTKTEYIPVQVGSHSISGDYKGSFTVDGNGTNFWTVECENNLLNIVQD